MDSALRCRVSRGMFSDEVAVRGVDSDGVAFSLFVSEDCVEASLPREESASVDGWLHVEVLDRKDRRALVRLPGQALENGQTVTVDESNLSVLPRRESV